MTIRASNEGSRSSSSNAPDLLSPRGVVDEDRADGSLAGQHGVRHQPRDVVAVPDVEYNLRHRINTFLLSPLFACNQKVMSNLKY